jgi:RasGEF domain
MVDDIIRESQLHFLQLNCLEVATQLTLRDFQLFRDIRPTEYIVDLFKLSSPDRPSQTANLDSFTHVSYNVLKNSGDKY